MSTLANLRVRDLMSRNLETIEAKATLQQAANLMSELRIHCLLIPPSDAQKSIGILTCKDIVQLLGDEPPEVLDEIRVKDAMTSPAITLQEHMSVPDSILLMRMSGVRSVPVMRADELVGLLSFTDVLDAVASS